MRSFRNATVAVWAVTLLAVVIRSECVAQISSGAKAVGRAISPWNSADREEGLRRQAIANQLGLESLVQFRSGLPVSRTAIARQRVPAQNLDGTQNLYSPYYQGPFEPAPFWPGFIQGYPYINRIAQPTGHRITPLRGDIAHGYVYEPTYENPPAATVAAPPAHAQPSTVSPQSPIILPAADDTFGAPELSAASAALSRADYVEVLNLLDRRPASTRDLGEAELLRSFALIGMHDYRGASTMLHRGLNRVSERRWEETSRQVAELLPNAEEYTRLVRDLETYANQHPDEPAPRFVLGFLYGLRGYPTQAVQQLQFALDLGIQSKDRDQIAPEDLGQDAITVRLLNHFQRPRSRVAPARPAASGPRAF